MLSEVATLFRVRVWFGCHVVAEHVASAGQARRYQDAMRVRFAGLQVTCEPLYGVDAGPTTVCTPLPSERLWELTP